MDPSRKDIGLARKYQLCALVILVLLVKMPRLSSPNRENILVLDVFFEALNYETIEQRKAYEVAGLLGKCVLYMGLPGAQQHEKHRQRVSGKNMKPQPLHSLAYPWIYN